MPHSTDVRAAQFYAETYDACTPDWSGEIEFYRELAAAARDRGGSVLEIGCGTGRIARRLAKEGANVAALDSSQPMLDVAREMHPGTGTLRWILADMRSFALGETFALVIIPGHSFQFMLSTQDQVACLGCIRLHLQREGLLVIHTDHQDVAWLGDLPRSGEERFEPAGRFRHPKTGRQIRTYRAWSYAPASQTATSRTYWEELDDEGQVTDRWDRGATQLHCLFRFEMEHLLARTGFEVDGLYGDFHRHALQDVSTEMIWLIRGAQRSD